MPIDNKPQIIKRVEALENRYTDTGLNTQTFPISDAVDSARSDIAASSKAVKTANDAGTRYATTSKQGQVILTHDVESGAQDRALTPFGAKTALDELEKNITDRLDELEASLNERIKQIINEMESKFNELNIKIEGKLPLFEFVTSIGVSKRPILAPDDGASLWLYFGNITNIYYSSQDASDRTSSSYPVFGFVSPGSTVLSEIMSTKVDRNGTLAFWRVFA